MVVRKSGLHEYWERPEVLRTYGKRKRPESGRALFGLSPLGAFNCVWISCSSFNIHFNEGGLGTIQ